MGTKLIFRFLKVAVNILFYFLVVIALVILVTSVITIATGNGKAPDGLTNNTFTYQVMAFGSKNNQQAFTYSADSLMRYYGVKDRYTLQVAPNSAMGYYALITKLIFLSLGIWVLWNFKKIFQETNLDRPFRESIVRRLKILAALFIISDILQFINYFLFNSYLHQSIPSPHFKLVTEVGNGLITGFIIWIIAVVYERGAALQEENALTV